MSEEALVYTLPGPPVIKATVIARPSKIVKSPYLADIRIDSTGETCMAHTPALGCCGYVAEDKKVWVSPRPKGRSPDEGASKYIIFMAETIRGDIIGIHPTVANAIVYNLFTGRFIFPEVNITDVEVTHGESRFDMFGKDIDDNEVFVEVKCAPIAIEGAAIFPHGNNRKKGLVSPRALKHVECMSEIKTTRPRTRCILVYLTMRTDCDKIQISTMDETYRAAVLRARDIGVEIVGYCIKWVGNKAIFHSELPVV